MKATKLLQIQASSSRYKQILYTKHASDDLSRQVIQKNLKTKKLHRNLEI